MKDAYMKYVELRNAKNITDYRVSQQTGIGHASFDDWKKGRCKPSVNNLLKLSQFFGVTLDYFI